MLVATLMREQCPGDTRGLRCQRHRSDVLVAPSQQLLEPLIGLIRLALEVNDYRTRPVDEQGAQIHVAALADSAQFRFAPSAFVARLIL